MTPTPVLGIIPARAGSKRLQGKNLRELGGRPLVAHVIEAALSSELLDKVIVSSDDEPVLEIAEAYQEGLALRRPEALAADDSLAIDYVRHALSVLEGEEERPRFGTVVILQPTSPFTRAEDIDATLRLLQESGADSAVSVAEIQFDHHPVKLKTMQGSRLMPYLEEERGRMAHHQLPSVYVRNGSVYASRRKVIESGQVIGEDCRGHVMPRERSVDINDDLDYQFAQFLYAQSKASADGGVSSTPSEAPPCC